MPRTSHVLRRQVLLAGWTLVVLPGISAQIALAEELALPESAERRAYVERCLEQIASSAREFTRHRDCFSCHHQALPALVLSRAQAKGFDMLAGELEFQAQWTHDFLARNRQRYADGRGTGGQVDTAGYALWTLQAAERPADETTSAVVEYLHARHANRDHWICSSKRPPSEATDVTTTFLALQGLRRFASSEQAERAATRCEQALTWLRNRVALDTEEHVFRLRALHLMDRQAPLVQEAGRALIARQRADGGWSQLPDMDSDAYATATALVVLHDAEIVRSGDDVYRRGLAYLWKTRQADGSWHVTTRSEPIQTYFETGFPHGTDQFISMAATCWAVMAFLETWPDAMPRSR